MKNFKLLFVGILVSCVSLYSCNDLTELEVDNPDLSSKKEDVGFDYKVEDGIIMFENADAFFRLGEKLLNMDSNELKGWKSQKNFTSFYSVIQDVNEQLDTCTNVEDFNSIISANKDVVSLKDDTVEPLVKNIIYQYIANKNRYFAVNGVLHKVTNEGVYTSNKMSYTSIENAIGQDNQKVENDVSFLPFQPKNILKSIILTSDHVSKETPWDNRRKCRAVVDLQLLLIDEGSSVTVQNFLVVVTEAIGRRIFGGEKLYDSKHFCEQFSTSVSVLNYYQQYGKRFTYKTEEYSISYESSDNDCERYYFISDYVGNAISLPLDDFLEAVPASTKIEDIIGNLYTRGSYPNMNEFDYTTD